MIKRFDEYSVNEAFFEGYKQWALGFFLLFRSLTGDVSNRYDMEYFQNYTKTLNIANKDFLYQSVLQEAKRKVQNDPNINNKSDVLKKLDEILVVYRKNDEFMNLIFRKIDKGDLKTRAAVFNHNIMVLPKDCRPEEIYHELMHVAYDISNSQEEITKFFNFNNNVYKQEEIIAKMTDSVWYVQGTTNKQFIDYLKQPTEIYARLNEFKFFLFRNKIINSPYQKLTTGIVYNLINGTIYKNLNKNEQRKFPRGHFIELFKFLDVSKIEMMK